jgi:hypothetical protein
MDPNVERYYEEIGREIVSISTASRVLAYADLEDGVVSVSVFDVNDDRALYRDSSEALDSLFYDFWEAWKSQPGATAWRLAVYTLDGGKFRIDVSYPDEVDASLDHMALRRETLKKHLGSLPIKFR